MRTFMNWLDENYSERPLTWSDNPGFDFSFINYYIWLHIQKHPGLMASPLGHSMRRIGDLYAGHKGEWMNSQGWKKTRDR